MRMIPVLIKPRLLTLKNRWFKRGTLGLKEFFALPVSLLMMCGVYVSTLKSLENISKTLNVNPMDPLVPLALTLTALFILVYLSAVIAALNSLFTSNDQDIIRAAPVSSFQFLIGKTLDVGISVSWMVSIFGIPVIIAFGQFFNAKALFHFGAPLVCILFLAVATVLGMASSLLIGAIIPHHKGRAVPAGLCVASLLIFVALLNGFSGPVPLISAPPEEFIDTLSAISANPYLPGLYCARAILALLGNSSTIQYSPLLQIAGAMLISWGILHGLFAGLYERGLARTRHTRGLIRIHSRLAQNLARMLFPFSSSAVRAIMTKEYKVFSRDVTHTIQLGLLLAITFVYLYNYQIIQSPANASEDVVAVWNVFLLISNIALGSLVITSICSRFVFPSVSLEGNAFWLIQSAPLSVREVLNAKFKSWAFPVSCIGGVIFISGAMALNAEGPLVIASCLAGVIVCQGIVGLGVGLGALFSQFEWEHSSQLSTSFGSFVFMITSIIFMSLNMVPLGAMFAIYIFFPSQSESSLEPLLVLSTGLLATYVLGKLITWWALSAGSRALRPH